MLFCLYWAVLVCKQCLFLIENYGSSSSLLNLIVHFNFDIMLQ